MRFALLFLIFQFVFLQQISAQSTVTQGKTPSWVTAYEYSDIADTTESIDGYAYLLVSRQNHLETKEEYYKYVMKVTSEKGLSTVASINEWFDPSFQKLTFHELNIIRNGKTINKLNLSRFDVLRREEEMERAVYDKSVNAVYNLADVRVGDIVEYAFTRKGFNPAFGDHTFGTIYLQYGTSVGKFACRIVSHANRKITFKTFGDSTIHPHQAQSGQMKTFEWVRENVPAVLTDDQYPSWFNPYTHVKYSDFQSWDEVKAWASKLYEFPKLNNGDLKKVIGDIAKSGKSDIDKIKECIRISQGDIRYLSFSDGIHGYKPHSPEMVYDQKYGDCKDKSFMLSLMLNEMGIKSSPALVSTENGYVLNDMLPIPWEFNHCIVRFTYQDSTYWVDPTLDAQMGPLKSYYFPSYHHALVIKDDHAGLTPIPFGDATSKVDVAEEYSMNEVGGFATLKVKTTYSGSAADYVRSYYRANTTVQINKDYLNFYAKDFSEIEVAKSFRYENDSATNVVVSYEEYLIKNFWTQEKEKTTASVSAGVLGSYLKKPETRIRTMPLAISYPSNISQTITIRMPEEWTIKDEEKTIESEGFIYNQSTFYADKVVTLRYTYRAKAPFIGPDAVADHIAKITETLNDTGYSLYKTKEKPPLIPDRYQGMLVAIAFVIGVGIIAYKKLGER